MSSQSFSAACLQSPVEILIDQWGIPHIYAQSASDAYFAQGFNAARDRLWQIDLWRRAGLGLLAEVLGPEYVERDRAARLFLYRGATEDEFTAYGYDLKAVLTPFVAGINEYVEAVLRRPELLPIEFHQLGYTPAEWSITDLLRIRAHGRYRNVRSEVTRARILHEFGERADSLRIRVEPETEVVVPEGLDLSLMSEDVLRAYDLATGPSYPLTKGPDAPGFEGSNNWVIGPHRSATGRPILANDPHRALSLPSLRYLSHISYPGTEMIGGGEPMQPGISFGHNGILAFGLTVIPVDYEDLYVYETEEVCGTRYRYGSGWEKMTIEHQEIPVRGGDPVQATLKFTRHGPVVHESAERRAAFVVRAAWLEPGMVPYLASIALLQCTDWEQFRAAAVHWGAPGENLVYADMAGNIGWQPAARAPIRPNWTGLLPVPGDGRFEWAGFADASVLQHELNPPRGWIATANQFNIPPDAANGINLAFEWEPPFRHQRIADVLDSRSNLTVEHSAELQNDYLCLAAERVVPLALNVKSSDPRVTHAVRMLGAWDRRLQADSGPAALFEVWFRFRLRRALFAHALAPMVASGSLDAAVEAAMGDESAAGDARIDLELIESLGAGVRDLLFESTLRESIGDLERLLGPDRASWRWGRLHHATFEHPFGPDQRGFEPIGPAARGGSGDTVGNTLYGDDRFREIVGATLRLVLDVGEWDNSLAMNAPGQSGAPTHPHYADLLATWVDDQSIPLLFSREAVERAIEHRLVLNPERRPAHAARLGLEE